MFIGSSALGERGKPAERVGEEAARAFIDAVRSGASVDKYTGDNLILWCSLSEGVSEFVVSELTAHIRTAIELSKRFTGAEASVGRLESGAARIRIKGIGFRNSYLG
jgi:RNA 3'-terminal phosphate cyclase (ATP)